MTDPAIITDHMRLALALANSSWGDADGGPTPDAIVEIARELILANRRIRRLTDRDEIDAILGRLDKVCLPCFVSVAWTPETGLRLLTPSAAIFRIPH